MTLFSGYNTKGAAWMLGVSVSTIKRMVYHGQLKPIVSGPKFYLFSAADLKAARNRK
jgi:predicted site-specific integrase-resolvase